MSFAHKTKPTLVVDTSALLSACIYPERRPAQALSWALRHAVLVGSASTFAEANDVLLRPHFERWRDIEQRKLFVAGYHASLKFVSVATKVTDCRDVNDNQFLSLALAANADAILASDPDLLVLSPYRGIDILGVSDFLARIGAALAVASKTG